MSVYTPTNEPPGWAERILSHPEVVLAMLSVVQGAQIMVDPLVPGYHPSPALGEVPLALAIYLALVLAIGGVLTTVGVLNGWDNRSRAWRVERSGWVLLGVGWGSYSAMVINAYPGSSVAWVTSVGLAIVGLVRLLALYLMERAARRAKDQRRAMTDTASQQEVDPPQ